jgi:putative ABC transport system ATP-binding protein
MSIINFSNVTKEYRIGDHTLRAVADASFNIESGELALILGPSGAGKSTILNLLGGMDYATSGEITVNGQKITGLDDNALTDYRAKNVGFVFQFYNLIPTLTAMENVALARDIVKNPIPARDALEMVGLIDHADQFPAQLSGGEQQRVAIARAVAKNPAVLLCDEPTGALDSETGTSVFNMLREMCRKHGKTVVIVTHNAEFSALADRIIHVRNGAVK